MCRAQSATVNKGILPRAANRVTDEVDKLDALVERE
jgi:hypothetical protein